MILDKGSSPAGALNSVALVAGVVSSGDRPLNFTQGHRFMINDNALPGSPPIPPCAGRTADGRRRVRMTREPGQSLVLSSLGTPRVKDMPIEIRVSQVGTGGVAILDVLLPDDMFVERKETMDSVHALFRLSPAPTD